MIKSIAIKNLLINSVFKGISYINKKLKHKQNRILLYANNGFRDNIFYLYQYLIDHKYNFQYEIICAIPEYKDFQSQHIHNVKFVPPIIGICMYLTAGHVYYCFGRIPILPSNDQITIQMWHGISFKGFDKGLQKTNSLNKQFYTYVFASSEYFIPIVMKKFSVLSEKVVLCGNPKTDAMYWAPIDYGLKKYKKIIIWLPTFRQSKSLGYNDTESDKIVPFLGIEEIIKLDKYMGNHNMKLIVKFHPEQNKAAYSCLNLKMIDLLADDAFKVRGYDLYRLLPQTDALITDYSSVFYDYLLLDKPIGFTEDDIEEYRENRGFAVEDPDAFRPGKKIRNIKGLYEFLQEIEKGEDIYKVQRDEVNKIVNKYTDGENCSRALLYSNIFVMRDISKEF